MLRQLVAITLLVGAVDFVRGDVILYVSLAADQKISVYTIASDSGELVRRSAVGLAGEPGALTTDPKRKFLFASIRSKGQLASFRILPGSGNLEHLSIIPAGSDPAQLSTDRTGRFLFTAYYRAGKVTVHSIREDGSLSDEPLQSIPTAEKAHAILADRSNRFVFVPHTAPNLIFQFTFDAASGRLAANAVPKLATPPGTGPRHIVFHPTKSIAYVVNEQGSSVTAHQLDPSTGVLSQLQTITTLPAGFQGTNACAEIKVAPSGRFLYASNRGHDSIACFAIDEAGRPTGIGQTATEKTPRSFDLEPSGRFLYAAGEGSGDLATASQPSRRTLGDFQLIREVGRGGMGVVYEARQLSLDRRVALKVMPFAGMLDPRQLQRFKNEAQAAAQLEHAHIVDVIAVGCERGVHYYAMRLLKGGRWPR